MSGSSPPASPLVQHTSQPVEPSSIQRAAVAAGPKSASSGWATITMNRSGRQGCADSPTYLEIYRNRVRFHVAERTSRLLNRGCSGDSGVYDVGRGFARLPPRAKSRCFLAVDGCRAWTTLGALGAAVLASRPWGLRAPVLPPAFPASAMHD